MIYEENSERTERKSPLLENYRKINVNTLKMPPHTGINPPPSPKFSRAATTAEQYAFYSDQLRSKR